MIHRYMILIAAAAFLLPGSVSPQGLVWTSIETNKEDTLATTRTSYMPGMFKITGVTHDEDIIIRSDKEIVISVNHPQKHYWQVTFQELETLLKQMGGAMEEMRKKMDELPPEARAMMKDIMGGKKGAVGGENAEVVKTGSRATISGYRCEEYAVRQGKTIHMSFWTTGEVKGFEPMAKDFGQFTRMLIAMDPSQGAVLADAMKKLKGFPIRSVAGDVTTTVTAVEQRATPVSDFSPPGGYTKVEAPMLNRENEKP